MNSRLSSFLLCSCYASLRWMQHQQWLVLPFCVDQGLSSALPVAGVSLS